MRVVLSTLRRTLLVPSALPVIAVSAAAAWLGTQLARGVLGGDEGFVEEVRHGSLLFAGALVLSLAEPLEVGKDARSGLLLLRRAKDGGFALVRRWMGLLLAVLPVAAVTALAAGGLPEAPLLLLVELGLLCAGGLLLGACFDRAILVPALWGLLVLGHLRPWLDGSGVGSFVALLVPRLGDTGGGLGLLHAALWCCGALLLADRRLVAVSAHVA
ncbi:MAG: hypothetical protein H6825_04670 [Planctomycetes bacterium]|nr:hypothetical protein [Planctomycetota bacterium]